MYRKWAQALLLCLIAAVVLFGCQSQDSSDNEETEISIVASFLPIYEFTKQVAGDRADVQLMVSEGQDAHHFEPSAQDVASVNEADVFVYSSEEMEFWVESLLNTVENDKLVVARAADGLEEAHQHDHEAEPSDTGNVQVEGAADHYHTGDEIVLTAALSEDIDYNHWHWYQRTNADEEWEAISGQSTETFTLEAPEESFEVQAVIYDNDHNVYGESEPIAIHIDNHDGDHEHGGEADHEHEEHEGHEDHDHGDHAESESAEGAGTVEIVGLADHYHTGDVVTLIAELSEAADYDHWHWFMREDADQDWEAVPEQMTDHFEYQTTGESFEVKAVLYDNDHNVYAESEPVSVLIDDHEEQDPHIWLDPVLAQDQVLAIRDALIEADPDGKDIYEANAEAFNEELQTLDEEYQAAFEDAENRVFVVQHQAFGYLADRYNLEQVAIGGLSTEVEPSPSRMAEIGELVQEYDVPVIYYQQGASSAIAQTVATETGTETAVLYDLEVQSEEIMEEDLGYLEAMRSNLEALRLSIQ
ncbi:metal ABC transporter solute-binding protein, Zn/Mn family [Gracilibacillus alcaliphilus]|uniref:metal ABC transporter solute-binding protein, Zn/Mn family n=1 Tax=Gracilibacillus alcaliphilus TaxID=1401441 RepID=UPI00195C0558|nr:zinc ABC transporter substrate-binding protein [Gracilibacillus alcaliphilus]MBM7677395.1 zinc transport system substrate-binding protein [Gracilibacillus alcaliphilus]